MVTHGMILRFIHHVVLFFKGSAIWLNQASRVIPVTKFVAYKWQNSSPNPLTFLKFSSLTSIVQRLIQKSSPVLRPSSFRARHPLPLIFRFSFSFSKCLKLQFFHPIIVMIERQTSTTIALVAVDLAIVVVVVEVVVAEETPRMSNICPGFLGFHQKSFKRS